MGIRMINMLAIRNCGEVETIALDLLDLYTIGAFLPSMPLKYFKESVRTEKIARSGSPARWSLFFCL